MKNIVKIFIALTVILFAGCYDRDVADSKEFNQSLPKVENLNYTKQANTVKLTWQIPANISAGFNRSSLETNIQVVENNIYRQVIKVGNDGTTADFVIDPGKEYRVVVRLFAKLTGEARAKGYPEGAYSDGVVLAIQ